MQIFYNMFSGVTVWLGGEKRCKYWLNYGLGKINDKEIH